MTRLCRDCRWVRDTDYAGGEFATCHAPQNFRRRDRDVAARTGFHEAATPRYVYCSTHRSGGVISHYLLPVGDCGPLGSWWKPAEGK